MTLRSLISAAAAAGVVLAAGASYAAPISPGTPNAAAPAAEQVQARCSQMRNVWYTRPCINGWSYLCQHKSWGPGWGCRDTRRCTQREQRCR